MMERIDIGALERSHKGGGTSSYHPRLLLKVLVYAYLRNVYSSLSKTKGLITRSIIPRLIASRDNATGRRRLAYSVSGFCIGSISSTNNLKRSKQKRA